MNKKFLFLVFGLLICLLTFAVLSSVDPKLWSEWQPATCISNGCFCEQISVDKPLRQPINTASSLAFVVAGSVLLILDAKIRKRNSKVMARSHTNLLVASLLFIGIGSAFFHASLTLLGQFFDVFGMYLLGAFILSYGLKRLYGWNDRLSLVFYLCVVVLLGTLLISWPETRRFAFAIVLVLSIGVETLYQRRRSPDLSIGYWYTSIAVLTGAFMIWILDNSRMLCAPLGYIQGHAVWHVLGAISVVLLYGYYVSENLIKQNFIRQ